MDLFSLFLFTHENNEIKSPTNIYDFTVLGLKYTFLFAFGNERTLVTCTCKSLRRASRITIFTRDQCPFISQCKQKSVLQFLCQCTVLCYILEYSYIEQIAKDSTSPKSCVCFQHVNTRSGRMLASPSHSHRVLIKNCIAMASRCQRR